MGRGEIELGGEGDNLEGGRQPKTNMSDPQARLFGYLASAFIDDYMHRKYPQERSGWRSIPEAARGTHLSPGRLYGHGGGLGPSVAELIRKGYVEQRIFPGERGRGGEVTKLRVAYELKPVQSFVDRLVLGTQSITEVATPVSRLRIAVLPFANLGPDSEDGYFADGITEELISTLSKIGQLTVIARTSVVPYKNSNKRISTISEELQTGTIVEGSVRTSKNRVRITVQLLDGKTEGHLWSESYDRDLKDIFGIQREISVKVADSLRVHLDVREKKDVAKRATGDVGAYMLYLKGRYLWNERKKESVDKALRYFQEAIKLDSAYALAYSGMADCYTLYGAFGWLSPESSFPKAKEYAMKSLELDPRLAEAHTILAGVLNSFEGKWKESEVEYRRALELKASYSTAHMWLGLLLLTLRRYDEARKEVIIAIELDPLTRVGPLNLAGISLYEGKTKDTVRQLEAALLEDPEFFGLRNALGWAYYADGRVEEGISELEKAVKMTRGDPQLNADLACALGFAGKEREARIILEELQESSRRVHVSKMKLAQVCFSIGENDEGFNRLQEALIDHSLYTQHGSYLTDIIVYPWFSQVRKDPRWGALLNKVGLS